MQYYAVSSLLTLLSSVRDIDSNHAIVEKVVAYKLGLQRHITPLFLFMLVWPTVHVCLGSFPYFFVVCFFLIVVNRSFASSWALTYLNSACFTVRPGLYLCPQDVPCASNIGPSQQQQECSRRGLQRSRRIVTCLVDHVNSTRK